MGNPDQISPRFLDPEFLDPPLLTLAPAISLVPDSCSLLAVSIAWNMHLGSLYLVHTPYCDTSVYVRSMHVLMQALYRNLQLRGLPKGNRTGENRD